MHSTVEALIRGEQRIVRYYTSAAARWQKLLEGLSPSDVDEIARRASEAQSGFEADCDHDRYLGKETMAVVAFAHLYDTRIGFEGREEIAKAVHAGIQRSVCSLEVKAMADSVAAFYNLHDA